MFKRKKPFEEEIAGEEAVSEDLNSEAEVFQDDVDGEPPEAEAAEAGEEISEEALKEPSEDISTEETEREDKLKEENKERLEDMKLSEREAAVEAILFAAGDPVEADSIAAVIGENRATAEALAESLVIKYNAEKRGISIIKINSSYQMCTNRQFYNYIDRLFKQPKRKNMSQAILEVLAIIAYKQPVTKTEIEEIRGINSDRMVNKLVEYNLVCEMGRKKVPGRPILFGTTDEFLRVFGYSSTDALPELKTPDVNAFDEAAREVAERLERKTK
ncbi:MAG: SMC-Scp complex subunit ScpB [Clostridiales bacterium]|nr:SMC-Scp complex subunit ScpB [Clostridiales bacterium]